MNTLRWTLLGLVSCACLLVASPPAGAAWEVGLEAKDIERVVEPTTDKVKRCYARYAMKQKGATGKFAVDLEIGATGSLKKIAVDAPEIKGKRFARCVERVAEEWQFPESNGTTRATYPFHFVHTHAPGAGPKYGR